MPSIDETMESVCDRVVARDPGQKKFHQAFEEVLATLRPLFEAEPKYIALLETIAEPETVITFRVPWRDDQGNWHINRGYRVQFSSVLGPYKGGLRFHPTVNLSIIKFLGFEQTFKNALTGLPLGGGKGGSDFDPKGKSDNEVLSFCQAFMSSLYSHIGPNRDVPAGDMGVAAREIGYLFGYYRQYEGVLTGKQPSWGGSLMRTEATGYGVVYFAEHMLRATGESFEGKRCLVSGSGNVALHCAQKLMQKGATVLTLSDSSGTVVCKDGFTEDILSTAFDVKLNKRGRVSEVADLHPTVATFLPGTKPWGVAADMAFPCATQNEIVEEDAHTLVKNGVKMVVEGANMPTTAEATKVFHDNYVPFGPAKAANAGGVAVSGLEMAQNSQRVPWTAERVDDELREIMAAIFKQASEAAEKYGMKGNYQAGANIAGFLRVADSLEQQGRV
jgi:glutamate dehydrogenase (NADP+)